MMEYNALPYVKERARKALNHFLGNETPTSIRNPILLLNYLHQHSIISQPIYETIPNQMSGDHHFIVTCSIGNATTVGQGTSKKTAKTSAAQQQLDFLLSDDLSMEADFSKEPPDSFHFNPLSIYDSNPYSHVSHEVSSCLGSAPIQVKSRFPQTEKFYIDDLSNIYSFDSKENTEQNALDPQGPSWNEANETLTESKISKSVASMPYFDPFASVKIHRQDGTRRWPIESANQYKVVNNERLKPNNAASTSNHANTNSQNRNTDTRRKDENSVEFRVTDDQESFPSENGSDVQNSKICTSDVEKQNATYATSTSDIEAKNSSVNLVSYSSRVPSLDDYFDPFVKLRPASSMAVRSSLHSSCENNDDIIMKDCSSENSGKLENGKSPFALLKEKSFKMFKLIPRCHITENDSGFTCTLVVSSYTCVGEGSSKKLAKMNAATIMLEEIEKSLPSSV